LVAVAAGVLAIAGSALVVARTALAQTDKPTAESSEKTDKSYTWSAELVVCSAQTRGARDIPPRAQASLQQRAAELKDSLFRAR
jgi:hypothetical protein